MKRGRRSSTRWPLAPIRTDESQLLVPCYAMEGRNWHAIPPHNLTLLLVLVHPVTREHQVVEGFHSMHGPMCCDAVQAPWLVAGWLPADGTLPLGQLDLLDPKVARLTFLQSPRRHTPDLDVTAATPSTTPFMQVAWELWETGKK